MARVKGLNSIGYSGRIGNTICYEWRGRMCVRSKPSHYNDPKTERQLEVRSLFRQTVAFAGQAKQALRIGLRTSSLRAQMTECNYFMRMNRDCFALEEGELAVDYESLQFSEGPVAPVAFGAPAMLDERTIEVAFEKNPLGRVAHSEDLVYLVAYCPEYGHFEVSSGAYRYQKKVIITINEAWVGKEIHLWGFVRDSKDRASMSQYIGNGERRTENGVRGTENREQRNDNEYLTENNIDSSDLRSPSPYKSTAAAPPWGRIASI